MAFRENFQNVLKEYRIQLTIIRTAKLREAYIAALTTAPTSAVEQCGSLIPSADSSKVKCNSSSQSSRIFQPLQQISWLNVSEEQQAAILSQRLEQLQTLLGPYSILECEPIDELPMSLTERKQMVREICERVFSVRASSRDWLTQAEYDSRLSMLVTDVAQIRRYSVDFAIVERSGDGSRYWLSKKQ